MALGFLDAELTEIEHKPLLIPEGDTGYFREMLSRWLKWAPSNHLWPTLEALALALNKAGEESLAYDLKEQYLSQNGECCVHVFKCVSSESSPGIQNLPVQHCKIFVLWNAAQFSRTALSDPKCACVSTH